MPFRMQSPAGTPQWMSLTGEEEDEVKSQSSNTERSLVDEVREPMRQDSAVEIADFTPYEYLYLTSISLEYGENPEEACMIPLGVIQCYSTKINNIFGCVARRRDSWEQALALHKQGKGLLSPNNLNQTIDQSDLGSAMEFIKQCTSHFPLPKYQQRLGNSLERDMNKWGILNTKENLTMPPSNGGLKKKRPDDENIMVRLQSLNINGITHVIKILVAALARIKRSEMIGARKDQYKAAAQGRIILPPTEKETVSCVVRWTCGEKVGDMSADRLYKVHILTDHLGMQALAEQCLNKLITAYQSAMNHASREGLTLHSMLANDDPAQDRSECAGPLQNVVPVVIRHVLRSKNPPADLNKLVLHTIATSEDVQAFEVLAPIMSHKFSMELHRERLRVIGLLAQVQKKMNTQQHPRQS